MGHYSLISAEEPRVFYSPWVEKKHTMRNKWLSAQHKWKMHFFISVNKSQTFPSLLKTSQAVLSTDLGLIRSGCGLNVCPRFWIEPLNRHRMLRFTKATEVQDLWTREYLWDCWNVWFMETSFALQLVWISHTEHKIYDRSVLTSNQAGSE